MTAATRAMEDQVLAVLRDAYPLPLPTEEVVTRALTPRPGRRLRYVREGMSLYRRLYAMARRESPLVMCEHVEGMRAVYWRLAEPPEVVS